ncbi:Ku protein [Candidatus Poribacteria bacterium]|nr:Ku protein [Candidatus Poribacteria bacterium]
MAGRTMWKGYIHFGETDVPVKLHTAVKEERIQFHLLHKRDHVRLRQQMVCAYEKKPAPTETQVKAFEVEDGKYIIVDPSKLEQAVPESSRVIEVHEFVETDQIDPIFFDRVYYLEPDTRLKEYNALVGALKEMEVEGICTWTMRKRSYLGALQPSGKILRLNTLRYADEVIPVNALELQKVQRIPLSEKELKIGCDLINQLSAPFQPQKFEDEHQKKLQRLIEKKARGEQVVVPRPKRLKPTTSDKLLQALEASLKKVA